MNSKMKSLSTYMEQRAAFEGVECRVGTDRWFLAELFRPRRSSLLRGHH